jgi:hypothetical protein
MKFAKEAKVILRIKILYLTTKDDFKAYFKDIDLDNDDTLNNNLQREA